MHWTKNPKWENVKIEWIKKLKNRKPNSGSFKKGYSSPRKGKKLGWVGHSKPHTKEAKEKMSKNAHIMFGKDNPAWRGDNVGNISLHSWVKRNLGKPNKCEHCGTVEKRMYHWANKSHLYKRELTDWIRLCVPCHKAYDLLQYN